MSNKDQEKREFIKNRVNPILERLVVDLLIERPDDVLAFMRNWLDVKGPKYAEATSPHKSPGKKRREFEKETKEDETASEEDEDEDEDVVDLVQTIAKANQRGNRTSVSAEAYGLWNQKASYVPKVVQKSEDQKERIKKRLSQAFMFQALDEREQQIVVDAMVEVKFTTGNMVIQQGDQGDVLFVVDSGALDCFKQFKKDEPPTYLKTYQPGESFGELALLYNAPRAATIKAKEDSICFSLDRECFNGIVKDAAMKKREKYDDFLSKIDLLSEIDAYERSKIADALIPAKVKAGDYIVKEGENGDTFYFIEQGQAVATKTIKNGGAPEVVFEYGTGDYFGELALLKNIPRQANVIAKTDMSLVYMDRYSFKRLLGPLEDLLKRNFTKYEKFASL